MSAVCTVTLTGKFQALLVWGGCPGTPSAAWAAPQPVSTSPFGGVPRVTCLDTIGPGTNVPDGLMFDCST